jgi:hypothetical protein
MGGTLKKDSLSKLKMKSKKWTILCVGESGNISSIKLSKNSLIIMAGFVGITFLFTIVALITYATIKADNLQLQSSLEAVKTELNSTTEEKENLMAQLLIVREDLSSKQKTSKPSKKEIEPKKPEPKPLKPALAKQAEPPVQTISPAAQPPTTINMLVENFTLRKNPKTNRVRYEFFLKSKQPQKKAVSGYTFVLIKPDKGDQTSWRVSPKGVLDEGRPKNFKRGQLFSIARFKIVKGYIKDTESIDYWEEAVVLVYSYSGELVLEKVFDYPKPQPEADTLEGPDKPVQPDASISTQVPQQAETSD